MTLAKREYVLDTLDRYWGGERALVENLPIVEHGLPESLSVKTIGKKIDMPVWAVDACVDGVLLVPDWAAEQAGNMWDKVDWYAVCFWYLHNCAEREYEKQNGPAHSYSFKLKDIDTDFWTRAWVNRIALFLRKWATFLAKADESILFGEPPAGKIHLTHDVDAVSKTFAIRFKQTAFHGFNVLRLLAKGQFCGAVNRLGKTLRFLFSRDDYWCFDQITTLEEKYGVKSIFNFYAGKPGNERNYKERLLDPAYSVHSPKLRKQIQKMNLSGWQIGLHPSFDAWSDRDRLQKEKATLEGALGASVEICRQHWLRFSFAHTWETQRQAGFNLDMTLGFNDRSGFRNGAALMLSHWDEVKEQPTSNFSVLPLVLMDSHLYDYQPYSEEQRREEIRYWVNEIKAVGGEASVVWHQRVMSRDYGWADGYHFLLKEVNI